MKILCKEKILCAMKTIGIKCGKFSLSIITNHFPQQVIMVYYYVLCVNQH